jgi:hypothetical protein
MNERSNHINEIKEKLKSVQKKEFLKKTLTGFNFSVIIFFAVNFLITLIELFGARSIDSRIVLFYSLLLISIAAGIFFVLMPLTKYLGFYKNFDLMKLAKRVGNFFPDIKDNLVNSIQLIEDKNNYGYSEPLVQGAFESIYNKTKSLDFTKVVNYKSTKKYFQLSAGVIVFSVIVFAIFSRHA